MGDLRNKAAKEYRRLAHEKWLRKHYPPSPPRHLLTVICRRCLHNDHEVVLYACQLDRWRPVEYWCEACMPPEIKAEAGL